MPTSKTKREASVFLIHGEDELSLTSKAKEIIRQAIPREEETLGLEMINARSDTVADALAFLNQCREAVQTLGFLGGRKATWLRNANFLDQSVLGKSKDVRARLQDLADIIQSGLPTAHILVITSPEVDEKSPFFKACNAAGTVIGFEAVKPWQRDKSAIQFAARLFRDIGITASEDVIHMFVDKAGTDSRQLQQEAEKLLIYLGTSRTARREDIEAVVSPARELFTWNLDDAIADRDLLSSLRILRQLLFQKEEPIRLILGMEHRFRSLLIFRDALDKSWFRLTSRGLTPGAVTPEQEQLFYQALNDNRLKNPYVASLRARQSESFTRKELDRCRQWILKTRRQLVSSSLPESLMMEMLIIKICRTKKQLNH